MYNGVFENWHKKTGPVPSEGDMLEAIANYKKSQMEGGANMKKIGGIFAR